MEAWAISLSTKKCGAAAFAASTHHKLQIRERLSVDGPGIATKRCSSHELSFPIRGTANLVPESSNGFNF